MKAPDRVETARLILRRPRVADAEEVFARYAGDREVSRYMAWRLHESREATRAFLEFSEAEWVRWPAGPYIVESRADGRVLGGSGFAFETPYRAAAGYVFAQDSWGQGFATETMQAIGEIARDIGLARLYALCHVLHRPSARVLEKSGFVREGVLRRYLDFPNLDSNGPADVYCYARVY